MTVRELIGQLEFLKTPNATVVVRTGDREIEINTVSGVDALPVWIEVCDYCEKHGDKPGPRHTASSSCKSGKRNHCTCDSCY